MKSYTHVSHGPVCLGKSGVKRSLKSLPLSNYMKASATAYPPVCAYERDIQWGMLANDSLGDCTCADVLHHRMLQASVAHAGSPLAFTDADAINIYRAVGGYDGTPATDNGAVMLDVQNYCKANMPVQGFVTLDAGNLDQIKAACYIFGGVDIGLQVPAYIMNVPAGGSWSDIGADATIEGGHAVLACGYGRSGFRVVSWGTTYTANWQFWSQYVDEAYAWVSTDWIKASGVSPAGIDMQALLADLSTV
jgi:hypothetical protein